MLKLYDLKKHLYHCTKCNIDLYGEEEKENHLNESHDIHDLHHSLEWLVIIPGMDHMRYNVAKAIFNIYWKPYFEPISVLLGYESPSALLVAHNCTDLHKSDQVLAAFMKSGSEVLVRIYLEYCKKEKKDISADGFFQYIDACDNPNIKLLQVAVFTHTLGYFVMKSGIRKCNYDYFHCGKQMVMPLFFFGNHPIYRKLCLYYDFDLACMPGYMYEEIRRTIGLRIEDKGNLEEDDNGEHFDFVVEAVNKRIKNNLSWAPSYLLWLAACRTYDLACSMTKNMNAWFSFSRF